MPKFQLLTSEHHDMTVKKIYKKGDIIKSQDDLVKMFPNKFAKVGLPIPDETIVDASLDELVAERRRAKIREQMAEVSSGKQTRKGVSTDVEADARGVDVTSKFKQFDGFVVFQRDTKFHIYKGDSTKPINDKGLKEGAVEEFLTGFLED